MFNTRLRLVSNPKNIFSNVVASFDLIVKWFVKYTRKLCVAIFYSKLCLLAVALKFTPKGDETMSVEPCFSHFISSVDI